MNYTGYKSIAGQLGLKSTDTIWIASDLSRLMLESIRSEGSFNPISFLQSFTDTVSEGSVLVPGFKNQYFDGEKIDLETLKPDTGGLSSTAFKLFRKGEWKRTRDPIHSFFVKGKLEATAETLHDSHTFGQNSMFAEFERQNGKFIAIDIDLQHSFTYVHYREEQLKAPYRRLRPYRFTLPTDKHETFWVYEKKRGYTICLNKLLPLLLESGAAEEFRFGQIPVTVVDINRATLIIDEDIRSNKGGNLITFELVLYLKQLIKSIR